MTVHTSLPLTGERTVPDVVPENYWFRRHEAAYHWVERHFAKLIRDGVVVDAGCGEGYGINVLADNGPATALGLELDELTAAHAKAKYPALTSISRANLDALPLRDDSVDLLVSMQVIEHLWDLPGFLRECFRVTSPSGNCVLTTPNRLTFSPGLQRGQ
ncbi:MAG TPA: SAM-dependent methyltransferase, partial [Actinobacteria bacterium]|nr:SAM-dependent methyltransferase [Actinomycetota bacterium]